MNNRTVLMFASFMTLIAAGVGFAIRGAILSEWATDFGFSKTQLGGISGGGLIGFGVTILVLSLVADSIGYKPLMILAFILHVLSAIGFAAAKPVFDSMVGTDPIAAKSTVYWILYYSAFAFALGNGTCEAVINPLIATLYPKDKTHYLNILHAGWPGGLILGGLIAYCFAGNTPSVSHVNWQILNALYVVPTLIYGFLMVTQKFPESETKSAGVDYLTQLAVFASPILLVLLILHGMVGYVELGTDSWIQNIMDNVMDNASLLFVYTAGLMFVLRFFAGPIVEQINPLGLLLASAIMGCTGLFMLGTVEGTTMILVAATIFGIGKTFYWPTMLGVVGERFPKGGALAMGAMGAVGMLSAGLIGAPAIGYKQDFHASAHLKETNPAAYATYKAEKPNSFLVLPPVEGLDGTKVGEVLKIKAKDRNPIQKDAADAAIYGGRMALKLTAIVPFLMAIGYLGLALYFRSKGGYQVEVLHGAAPVGEHYTGGMQGPME